MTGFRLSYLFLESADRFAIITGCNCRDRSLEGTGFLDALGLHVFEKLRSYLGFLDQLDNSLGLRLVDRAAISVVIIADHYDVEDVAGDIAAQDGVGAADGLPWGVTIL